MQFLHLPFAWLALTLAFPCVSSSDDILIMGDSMAELSNDVLANTCSGKSVVNLGIGGSTAHEFFTGEAETEGCIDSNVCSAKNAFKSKYGSGYTHVWLSVGGNDWLGAACDSDIESTLKDEISGVIDSVFNESPEEGIKLLITGYGYPSDSVGECPKGNEKVDRLHKAIKQAAVNNDNSDSILFVQATLELFGGSTSNYSDDKWFADAIHLNDAGYEKLFSLAEIQDFLQCGDTSNCQDDNDWVTTHKGNEKGCNWFSTLSDKKKKKFCKKKKGEDDSKGKDSCPVSCDTCPQSCVDNDNWEIIKNGNTKKCDWFSTMNEEKKEKFCKKKGEDGTKGKKSCPVSCGTCP